MSTQSKKHGQTVDPRKYIYIARCEPPQGLNDRIPTELRLYAWIFLLRHKHGCMQMLISSLQIPNAGNAARDIKTILTEGGNA